MNPRALRCILVCLLAAVPFVGCDGGTPESEPTDTAAPDSGEEPAAPGGLGCECGSAVDCNAGFCSDLSVCTTNDAVECQSDSDCDCQARCAVFGLAQSCQIPCLSTADCPGALECVSLEPAWTTTNGDTVLSGCVAPSLGAQATWEGGIRAIVEQRCAGCHLNGNQSGGVSFDTYANTQAVVSDCPPGTSVTLAELMAQKVSPNPPCGAQMPLSGGPLSADDIALFAAWAEAGAPEK
jgi:hypothetical protein